MEHEDLKDLIGLLKDTDITELQVEKEGVKIKIKREKHYGHFEPSHQVMVERKGTKEEAAVPAAAAAPDKKLLSVASPIVGTFYRSPSPEASPFVEVGTRVRKGQVLCIVEAMKLMNEIESDADGVIAKIMVENAHPVEYGEPLFLIDPAG
jgi:acetyl-CoA carboxylase biotin carboxyl carrier protein